MNEAAFEANARQPDTDMAMSSTSSRTVRYAEPARRVLISVICPAIHAAGQRSTAVWNFWLSTLTGQGLSALPAALRRPLRRDCKVLFLIHAFKVYVQKGQVFLPARASPSDGIIVGRLFGDGLAATR